MMTIANETAYQGQRVLSFYGVLLANFASFGILFFWVIGLVLLWTDQGGTINLIGLDGIPLLLFYSYPAVLLISLGSWLLYVFRLDLPALGLAGAPVALATLYYLWLVLLRVG